MLNCEMIFGSAQHFLGSGAAHFTAKQTNFLHERCEKSGIAYRLLHVFEEPIQ